MLPFAAAHHYRRCGSGTCTRPCAQEQQASSHSKWWLVHQASTPSTEAPRSSRRTGRVPPRHPHPPLPRPLPRQRVEIAGLRPYACLSDVACRLKLASCRHSSTRAPGARSHFDVWHVAPPQLQRCAGAFKQQNRLWFLHHSFRAHVRAWFTCAEIRRSALVGDCSTRCHARQFLAAPCCKRMFKVVEPLRRRVGPGDTVRRICQRSRREHPTNKIFAKVFNVDPTITAFFAHYAWLSCGLLHVGAYYQPFCATSVVSSICTYFVVIHCYC